MNETHNSLTTPSIIFNCKMKEHFHRTQTLKCVLKPQFLLVHLVNVGYFIDKCKDVHADLDTFYSLFY